MKKQTFILASQSPRRINILKALGYNFSIQSAKIEEFPSGYYKFPDFIVSANSIMKAKFVSYYYPNEYILAFDTVCILDNYIIGKPKNYDDAVRILNLLSGKVHIVATNVILIKNEQILGEKLVKTEVKFLPLTNEIIKEYLRISSWQDKAGAYAIQEEGAILIDYIKGSYTNIIGLPVKETVELINKYIFFKQ